MSEAHLTDRPPESLGDFRLADLCVFPAAGRIEGPGGTEQVDPKVMAVFELLARNAGELVGRDVLLDSVWEGRIVSDDVISRCIYQLRRHLARAAGHRTLRGVIKTLPKRGYLLDAPILPLVAAPSPPAHVPRSRSRVPVVAVIALLATAGVIWWLTGLSKPVTEPAAPTIFDMAAGPTVAVLPFTDLSPEVDQAWFADGISEEIIGRLANYEELRVIGRTSSFALRDSGYGSREISDLLGAQYLLEGSVRKDGEDLRISAQLVDRDGVHLWGATFDREMQEIFAIQREIAQVVATSILPQVVPSVREPRQPNVEAYREYLLGKDLLARRTGMFFDEAAEHFSRAIEIDPDFAAAYAARAVGLFFRSRTVDRYDEQIEQALRDVETALELDPELGQAYAAKALLLYRVDPGNYQEREALLRRALELNPAQPNAWNWLSGLLSEQARYDEAEEASQQGLRFDPLNAVIVINEASRESRKGRFEEAAKRLERLLRLPNPSSMAAQNLVEIYAGSGQFAEALSVAKRLILDASPDEGRPVWTFPLIAVYTQLGMHDLARYWLDREVNESPPSYFPVTLFVLNLARGALGLEETLVRYRAVLKAEGLEAKQLPIEQRAGYGMLLSLTGDHAGAIAELEPILQGRFQEKPFMYEILTRQALAWSLQQTGQPARAETILQELATHFGNDQESGLLQFGPDLASAALNALLLGDTDTSRQFLEQAVTAGWRDHHNIIDDPRWDAARADPVLADLLLQVKSDLERQRAEIEATENHHEFVAQVDAVISAGRGREDAP